MRHSNYYVSSNQRTVEQRIFDMDLESIYGIYVHVFRIFSIKKF